MAYVSKKPRQKPHEPTLEELRERDAMALAQLIYDIYQDKKLKEQTDDISQNIRKTPKGV
jgi:predicted DNA-binding ribbon-helix-helix protein